MTPREALLELKSQHDALRTMLDTCERLADEVDLGRTQPSELLFEVRRLRKSFDIHNTFEEHLLRPLLRRVDAFAEARIARLIDDHIGEHHAIRAQLATTETGPLRDVIETLRAHLEAEERYLLTDKVLRDDVIVIEGTG